MRLILVTVERRKAEFLRISIFCALLFFTVVVLAQDRQPALDVRVMSFNIRYGTADDGDNHWEKRKQLLVATIKAFNPDLLGTQETLAFQRDYLAEQLPEYEVLGVGRDDGREEGEMMALYFRKERFEKLEGGHFWLSETPDQAGSKSWDSSLPRMVTWVKLQDRKDETSPPIAYFNTHFDHRGPLARLESARLVRGRIQEFNASSSIIVTGDFNTAVGSEPHQALFNEVDGQVSPIVDTYRAAHPEASTNEGTFSGFQASQTNGERLDWIGASRDFQVVEAAIDRTERNGHTPSDHFAVMAVLRR